MNYIGMGLLQHNNNNEGSSAKMWEATNFEERPFFSKLAEPFACGLVSPFICIFEKGPWYENILSSIC